MACLSEVHDVVLQLLRSLDQRYTPNRRQIVEALSGSDAPLTIDGLIDAASTVAVSSAYRNLVVLEEAGVVHRIVTADNHARFELTEDVTGAHHHHLVCTNCGLVLDVTLPDELETLLHKSLSTAASENGFFGAHHRIDLLGLCASCNEDAAASK